MGRVLQENGIDTTIDVGQKARIKTPFEEGFIPVTKPTTPPIKKSSLGRDVKGTGSDPATRLHAAKPWRPVQGLENVTLKGSVDVPPTPISKKVGTGSGFNDSVGIKDPKADLSGTIPVGKRT